MSDDASAHDCARTQAALSAITCAPSIDCVRDALAAADACDAAHGSALGTKMLAIEVLFRDTLLPPVFQGGSSIYRLTPCSAEVAYARHARAHCRLPEAIRCVAKGPKMCPCGHHEGFHADDGACVRRRQCRCAGLPPDCRTDGPA
jgi:hypothetical protein